MNPFDLTIYHAINHFAGSLPIVDFFMRFFAQYALPIYALLFIVAWFSLPKSDENYRHSLVISALAGVLALLLNVLISHIWYRSRPFVVLPKGSFHQIIPHSVDASFPSDHGSGSFAFAAASWGKAPKWISRIFTVLAILVAISRVYAGVHWPTDIIASFIVGNIAARILWKISPKIYPLTTFLLKIFKYGKKGRTKSSDFF